MLHSGSTVPADGIVVFGESYVDESMITGESRPVLKKVPDGVIGGTMNSNGVIHIKATHVGTCPYVAAQTSRSRSFAQPVCLIADERRPWDGKQRIANAGQG